VLIRMGIQVILKDLMSYNNDVLCKTACPVSTDSGLYVQQIADGDYDGARITARSPNPFAASCGLVCAAPCEDACRRSDVDAPVSIRSLKKFITEGRKSEYPVKKQPSLNQKVAVIGAGPAGLAAAADLARMGFSVSVFEKQKITGGQMRFGIPGYRLPDNVLDSDVEAIKSLGVEIHTNSPVSKDKGISGLFAEGYAAVFIGTGLQTGRKLGIDGSDLPDAHSALDYLNRAGLGETVPVHTDMLVIGGGLVALDAAREARRQLLNKGTKIFNINMASLEDWNHMPANLSESGRLEVEEALDENIQFHPAWGPHKIIHEDGLIKGMELIKVLSIFDETGRFNPKYDESNIKFIPASMIVFAIGQAANHDYINDGDGIELKGNGLITINEKLMTSRPGVFAGGDVAFGPGNLIAAVAHGKQAAISIYEYLTNTVHETKYAVNIEVYHTPAYGMKEEYDLIERKTPPAAKPEDRIGMNLTELSFDEEEAKRQGERCLVCHTSPIYNGDLCILCGRCVDICPQNILSFVPVSELTGENEETMNYLKGNSDSEMKALLKDDTDCIRCGLCAGRCPTGALTMERIDVITIEN
jgi:formate dehydrogenase (NADP+) beta subunit